MKRVKKGFGIIILMGVATLFGLRAIYRADMEPVSRTQYIMGTLVEITAYGKNTEPAIEAAFDRMRAIERQVGRDERSDISRINARAGISGVKVGGDTWKMMQTAVDYWKITAGAFDVSVGPLVDLWGFGYDGEGRLPGAAAITAVMPKIGSGKMIFNPTERSVELPKAGMAITVGGIAKGYAVEEAARILRARGVKNAIVNGGNSSIKVIGAGPPGRGWRIGIDDPRRPGKILGVIVLRSGESLGTSADNIRFIIKNGRRYSHIIDPRTGRPTARGIALVTVITENATQADILTKALFLNDIHWSLRFLKKRHIRALFVDARDRIRTTPGLKIEKAN